MSQLQKQIYTILSKKHGLKMSLASLKFLVEIFGGAHLGPDALMESLDFVAVEYVKQIGGGVAPISLEQLKAVVESLFVKTQLQQSIRDVDGVVNDSVDTAVTSSYFRVLDTFKLARYEYNPDDKDFVLYLLII